MQTFVRSESPSSRDKPLGRRRKQLAHEGAFTALHCIQAQAFFRTGDCVGLNCPSRFSGALIIFPFDGPYCSLSSKSQWLVEPTQRSFEGWQRMSTFLQFLFLPLFFLVPCSIGLLIPEASAKSSLTMFGNHCTRRYSLISSVPNYNDCLRAINHLPTRPRWEEGPFHNGPPEDPYQLPVTKVHNTCQVNVELHAGRAVSKASWVGVKGKAWLLNQECLKTMSGLPQLYSGGWTSWGRHERIVVTLAYPDELGEMGRNNVTAS